MMLSRCRVLSITSGTLLVGTMLTSVPSAFAQNPATTIHVDVNANRRAIDPRIYGTAYASTVNLTDLNFVINRYGGNNSSRYNWQQNADNRGNDWFFESIGDTSGTPGERITSFVQNTRAAGVGAQPMLTIPMIGYVAKLGPNRAKLASFSVARYGAQQQTDVWFTDAGNGIRANGSLITGNDPLDANIAADSLFQQGLIQTLVSTFGNAASGGVRYYIYDNEPSLWHATHRDVHPTGATMDEIKNKMIDYGNRIRGMDSGAVLVGPEEWGWSGYLYSGYDQQWGAKNGWGSLPDRNNHGGWDYLPWLLDQMKQYQNSTGKRLLDIFTVHFYPQGGEFSNDTSQTMQLRRNRSTRALWDPNYVDQTWIGTQVRLIPRIRGWVNTYYPGTQIGITEYNWGAEAHINGATTQADILGIFGREGLDIAARWTTPNPSTPTYKAMKMYRNYDGNRSTFGDVSVSATVANPDNLSGFAAQRTSDGAVTVMAVNKYLSGNTPLTINLANFTPGATAKVFQLTSSNAITQLADVTVSNRAISATLPPQSITLYIIPVGTTPPPTSPAFTATVSVSPSTLAPNATTTLTVNVRNTGAPASGVIVNTEVYNAAGTRVNQKLKTGQNFTTNQQRTYTYTWRPTKAGTYTVKLGVFNSDWTTNYYLNNNAATIQVQ